MTHPTKKMRFFFGCTRKQRWRCEAQAAGLFVYFWLDGGVGWWQRSRWWRWGGGKECWWWMKPPCTSNGGSDQCHSIVPLWQSGRIAVSLPAQWQARLSWEWREALFCHAKSLKPSSFRLGNPQHCVTASAAETWQSQSQRTHGPGSSELRRATAPTRQADAQPPLFFFWFFKGT